jgi:hypothetical protein
MQKHTHNKLVAKHEHFPTQTAGLRESRSTEIFDLADGEEFDLRIAPVAARISNATVRMLAYNGSIPGVVMMFNFNVAQTSDVMTAMNPVPELDVVVIGAGQAGLATGYHLGRAGLRYELLDGNSRVRWCCRRNKRSCLGDRLSS